MEKIMALWDKLAPYTEESPGQSQPSVKELKADGAKSAVVVCPGGGYVCKAPHEADPIAQALAARHISAYVLDYRVKPCHYMAPLTDARRAIRLVRSLGYKQVGILGFSAGGHLACTAATHFDMGDPAASDPLERLSCRPDFLVACYPVVSFTQYPHYGSCMSLLGNTDRHELERFFSAELNVTPETPPAFIWHTADDATVPVENSLLLSAALSRAGVPFALRIYPHGHHGLGLAGEHWDARQWMDDCAAFIHSLAAEDTQIHIK